MTRKIDFEYRIHQIWGIKEHVDLLMWRYADHPELMTEDQVINQLMAISNTLDLFCEKLFDEYKQHFELDEYASEEVKARREELFSKVFKDVEKPLKKSKKKK